MAGLLTGRRSCAFSSAVRHELVCSYDPGSGSGRSGPLAGPCEAGCATRKPSLSLGLRPRDPCPLGLSSAFTPHPLIQDPRDHPPDAGFEDNRRPERAWFSACELEFRRRERRPTLSETTSLGSSSVSENPRDRRVISGSIMRLT